MMRSRSRLRALSAALTRTPRGVVQRRAAGAPAVSSRSARRQPRYYPNLHPNAAVPVNRDEILRLQHHARSFALRPLGRRGLIVPNARYIFVRTADGETLMHARFRHPSLADGRAVLYAGEAYFENGVLRWWSNGSGHYRPDVEHADQAQLPLELFRDHEDVLKRGLRPTRAAAQSFRR